MKEISIKILKQKPIHVKYNVDNLSREAQSRYLEKLLQKQKSYCRKREVLNRIKL